MGDSNAGLHALCGLLLALEHRRRTGEGVLVEAAMVDAALNVAAEQIVEHSAYGALLERDGNRGPTAAPQNLYLTADTDDAGERDAWVAIAVATDEQWLALRDALGRPAWAMDPALATAAGPARSSTTPSTTTCRAGATSGRGDEIVDCLWDAGVPVAKVMQPHEQADAAAAAVPRLLRGRRPPGHRARPGTARCRCGSRADPTGSTAATRRCWASTTTRCCAASACPTTSWPSSRPTA